MSPKYDFTGKVALVTGSSNGIGREIALVLARHGAKVTITGRNVENLQKVAQEIEKLSNGSKPLEIIGDLATDQSLPEKLVRETVAKFGRLDYVVNNAGSISFKETFDNPELMNVYDQQTSINVRSVLSVTHQAVPHLEKTKGSIVNISAAVSMIPLQLIYSTSKAAVDMLTKTSASQLAPKGIRVNSVNPGPVWTSGQGLGNDNWWRDNEEFYKSIIPLKRIAQPEEIAQLAVFLLSDLAVNITGSIVVSDGGALVKAK